MTCEEALAVLDSPSDINYEMLDAIFDACGFHSLSPTWDTQVYYHPKYRDCGRFTARDDGLHVLTPGQREYVKWMIMRARLKQELKHDS